MKILIVDDQRSITDSISSSINWESIGIDECFVANSAKEAKLILLNFSINILLTDIEMPEENGISLLKWAKEKFPNIVGVFLTSHADFEYARSATQLGAFDYILQPAIYDEVEVVLKRTVEEAKKRNMIQKLQKQNRLMREQTDSSVDLFLMRKNQGNSKEAKLVLDNLRKIYADDFKNCDFKYLWLDIIRLDNSGKWTVHLLKLVFRNVLEEIFAFAKAKVSIGRIEPNSYPMIIALEIDDINIEQWNEGITQFEEFFNSRMEMKIKLKQSQEDIEEFEFATDENANRIKAAEEYIKANITRSVTRAEVADVLHLNEEYFSRQFKKYTGYTFKDYDQMVRMELAKKLLEQTGFSISLIAPKVGYDNFSYFSKVFKKYTDMTPQEYRKRLES